MSQKTAPETCEWISKSDASVRYSIKPWIVDKLVKDRVVSTRKLPGSRTQLRRDELERLLRESVTPATAATAAK